MEEAPPIIIYHHGLFVLGDPPEILPSAIEIAYQQVEALKTSGLLDATREFHVCINGGAESEVFVKSIFPENAIVTYHGLGCRNENLTIVALWERARKIEGEAYILYLHQKGSSHAPGSSYGDSVARPWRKSMMEDLVDNWRTCVNDLDTHDIVCSHWMWNMADGSQHIPAGNFLWVTSSFARRLPSIFLRDRIIRCGIAAYESRYEAEVFWGNGPRPTVKSYRPNGGGGVP